MSNDSLLNTSQTTRRKRAVTAFEFLRWRNNRIPYKLHPSLSGKFDFTEIGKVKKTMEVIYISAQREKLKKFYTILW